MAVYKCKMCGGDLNITDADKVVECDYCGTVQTVPTADNERKMTLFNRANRLRLNNEFDKAAGIYENIVAEFPEEAEAYWGLCLCNYGIEYVDDPLTGKKIPTCHRASFEKLSRDENFELAMEYADVVAQKVYRDEAREIDRINEEILSVSRNERPYDVFICYKETDEAGGRTPDSVMAQDIYDALTAKGYKVFFARISLESKLGQQYEPYIFAALNSAKIMLCIGTKYEYFHAVWVKNEWGRFVRLAAKDKTKTVIPCYRDMDPYDLPDAFKGLQAQDLGKLGAVQDLVRGVEKLMAKDAPAAQTTPVQASVVNPATATVDSLLKRAFIFLEDENWQSADEYAERVLDIDPECGEAYLAKVMAELKARQRADLSQSGALTENANLKKALRFGTEALKAEVNGYLETARVIAEEERKAREAQEAAEREAREAERREREALEAERRAKEEAERREREAKEAAEQRAREATRRRFAVVQQMIGAGYSHAVAAKKDGTVVAVGNNALGQCNVSSWREIIAISAGTLHTVGLKQDGTVVATGYGGDERCKVNGWRGIVAVGAGYYHTVGLMSSGNVIAIGSNARGQCGTASWRSILSISVGSYHTVGLKSDQTVVAVGETKAGQCRVSDWKGIIAIAAGDSHTVGLKKDGSVVAVGMHENGQCNVSAWREIIAIAAGDRHTVGLKTNGTVVATGDNSSGACSVSGWRGIVAVAAGESYTIGLKRDGTVVVAGTIDCSRCNVSGWKLFDNFQTFDQERTAAFEHARAALAAQIATRRAARAREKAALQAELPTLTGFFKAVRRKEVEGRLAEIEAEEVLDR